MHSSLTNSEFQLRKWDLDDRVDSGSVEHSSPGLE